MVFLSIPSIWDLILKRFRVQTVKLGVFISFNPLNMGFDSETKQPGRMINGQLTSFNPLNMGFDSETAAYVMIQKQLPKFFQSPQYGIWFWNSKFHTRPRGGCLGFQSPQYGIWFWNVCLLPFSLKNWITFNPLNMGFDSETHHEQY